MSQILVSPKNINANTFRLDSKQSHHVATVLHKKIGDTLALFDGEGQQYLGEITRIDVETHEVCGRVVSRSERIEKKARITLFQGLPKGFKFDYVLEKATELGVDEIQPFISQKNVIKISDESSKVARWARLVEAACKQSNRAHLPIIQPLVSLTQLEQSLSQGLSIVFDPEGVLKFSDLNIDSYRQINVIIGPESGFADDELAWLETCGAKKVSLGKHVFRTETAGLVALSLVNHKLGLL